jgi:hypothetical protein
LNAADEFEVVAAALNLMGPTPADLGTALAAAALVKSSGTSFDAAALLARLVASDPNDSARLVTHRKLLEWDHADSAAWAAESVPNTAQRRADIYTRLALTEPFRQFCDSRFPVSVNSDPLVVIARDFQPWYTGEARSVRTFFWDAYEHYLRDHNGWDEADIADLAQSTASVVGRISDPSRPELYQAKGLVVGYVQSGKTANFTGVIARAADAGYRLIIVLSGTMNILRRQTQRRVDKELIGRELIRSSVPGTLADSDVDYLDDAEWDSFISHGGRPSERGAFDWQRLTGPEYEYQSLKRGIDALEFDGERVDKSRLFYEPVNLHGSKARLMVIKKNGAVLRRVTKDLARIRGRLADIPTLVIDDESDQASLNTRQTIRDRRARSAINKAIVDLLAQLPRAQYVGYTATPFANVFVDPDDSADLFPKDFIISLPRPKHYMGVREFHDLDAVMDGVSSNERAYVRDVRGHDNGPSNLPRALDSYVLAGAIKLFRHQRGSDVSFKHHTMLVHTSHLQADHLAMAIQLRAVLNAASYNAGAGMARLRRLFVDDFAIVSAVRGLHEPFPQTFDELKPFIGSCWGRLTQGDPVLIVNGLNERDSPDFDRTSVWKVIVGGAKLSRGYTVEGLTVSYYRRTTGAADTLMQMGRWFGFRRGYADLVRLFIGREEPVDAHRTIDLYAAFEAVCRDEMEFRDDLRRYASPDANGQSITPMQVPPLVPQHLTLLTPTATNKMFNAVVKAENFGGRQAQGTLAPTKREDKIANEARARQLLKLAALRATSLEIRTIAAPTIAIKTQALVGIVSPQELLEFLRDYRWSKAGALERQMDFLGGASGSPGIEQWLIVAPQLKDGASTWDASGFRLSVISRAQEPSGRYNVYTDPNHVLTAEYLCGLRDEEYVGKGVTLGLRRSDQAVMLLYPVQAPGEPDPPNVGFALQFPKNNLPTRIVWGVRDPYQPEAAVIPRV